MCIALRRPRKIPHPKLGSQGGLPVRVNLKIQRVRRRSFLENRSESYKGRFHYVFLGPSLGLQRLVRQSCRPLPRTEGAS